MMSGLFRRRVVDHHGRESLLGPVLFVRPFAFSIFVSIVVAFVGALVSVLLLGTYAQRETAPGIVVPKGGLIRVYPAAAGIVRSIYVHEGTVVHAGDALLEVSTDRMYRSGRGVQAERAAELAESIDQIRLQIRDERSIARLRQSGLEREAHDLASEIKAIESELRMQEEVVTLAERDLARIDTLLATGHSSKSARDVAYGRVLETRLRVGQLKRELAARRLAQVRIADERARLPVQLEQAVLKQQREISELRARLATARSGETLQVLAPVDGIASTLIARNGDTVRPDRPVVSILPPSGSLEVELYVPTRAAGFTEVGQEVQIRVEAFPYQRFGLLSGRVRRISKATIRPLEIDLPEGFSEPAYRINVVLENDGDERITILRRLRAGMVVQGDLVRAHIPLIRWMLDPLYSLRGRA